MMPREPVPGVPADPHWPTAAAWLAGKVGSRSARAPRLAVLGVPISQASTPPNGAHMTPVATRQQLARFAPFAAGVGIDEPANVDLAVTVEPIDLGDLALVDMTNLDAQAHTREAVAALASDPRLQPAADLQVFIGGDDCIIRPITNGLASDLSGIGVLTLDAHHDVRVHYRNQGPHNGSPIRGLIDDGLDGRNVFEIGIAAFGNSAAYRAYCDEHGFTIVEANHARREGVARCVGRHLDMLAERVDTIVVDLDLGVMELGFAPAAPGARPGGLAPHEVHEAAFAAGRHPKVKALCLVEVDPTLDATGCGVDNVCLCLLHAAAGLALRRPDEATSQHQRRK